MLTKHRSKTKRSEERPLRSFFLYSLRIFYSESSWIDVDMNALLVVHVTNTLTHTLSIRCTLISECSGSIPFGDKTDVSDINTCYYRPFQYMYSKNPLLTNKERQDSPEHQVDSGEEADGRRSDSIGVEAHVKFLDSRMEGGYEGQFSLGSEAICREERG